MRLLSFLPEPAIPPGLLDAVLSGIYRAQMREWRRRALLFVVGGIGGMSLIVSQWSALMTDVTTSSSLSLLWLAMDDSDVFFAHAEDFILGVLEALPVETMLIALVAAFFVTGGIICVEAWRNVRQKTIFSHVA